MSPRLPVVTGAEVARVAERLTFRLHRQRGSHAVYYRARDKARVVIPMHAGRAIKPKTLSGILDDMGVDVETFRKML